REISNHQRFATDCGLQYWQTESLRLAGYQHAARGLIKDIECRIIGIGDPVELITGLRMRAQPCCQGFDLPAFAPNDHEFHRVPAAPDLFECIQHHRVAFTGFDRPDHNNERTPDSVFGAGVRVHASVWAWPLGPEMEPSDSR